MRLSDQSPWAAPALRLGSLLHLGMALLFLPSLTSAASMLMDSRDLVNASGQSLELERRGSVDPYSQLWAGGIIPYDFAGVDSSLANTIRDAFNDWEWGTCIRFVPKEESHTSWIDFQFQGQDCFAKSIGLPQAPGAVSINLGSGGQYDCTTRNRVNNQLGKIIGMRPEETRSDRDLSINVFIENVKPEKRFLFDIDEQANISIPYDITSIMQDPGDYFAQGTGLTMVSIANGQTIAPGDRPNTRDYEAVNNAYRCDPSTTSPTTNCLQAPVSSDYDHSSYNFKVDQVTVEFAKSQGWHYIGLRQHCKSNLNDQDTDDWGFADILDTSGPDVTYSITTDRCKKTHDRHVKYYQLYLCSSKKEESCAYSCDQRGICPVQSPDSTVGVETKSVSFTDNWMWICHYHM